MSEDKPADRFSYIRRAAAQRLAEQKAAAAAAAEKTTPVDRSNTTGIRCMGETNPPGHRFFDVSELLDHLFRQEQQGPWARSVGVYHPSSLNPNTCRRRLYHDRIGTIPQPNHGVQMQGYFDEGHGTHYILQERLKKHLGFREECSINIEHLHIRGHTDGVFDVEDWMLEIKTMGDASFGALVKPKTEHVWQIHPYMFGMDIPRAQLLYVNRNNGRRRNFKVYFDIEIWNQIVALIEEIEGHVARQEEPPMTDKEYECRSCTFQYHCFRQEDQSE